MSRQLPKRLWDVNGKTVSRVKCRNCGWKGYRSALETGKAEMKPCPKCGEPVVWWYYTTVYKVGR